VAVSILHLARMSLALRAAQCTMEEPTMVRSLFTEKYEKIGAENFLYNVHLTKKFCYIDGNYTRMPSLM
jgi:hypothetical protein